MPLVRWSIDEMEYLRKYYQSKSIVELATALGRSIRAIKMKGHHLGLRQKEVNHNFFSEWSPEMSWVLGFWAADGCVVHAAARAKGGGRGAFTISFGQKDKCVLEKIKVLIGSNHDIHIDHDAVHSLKYNSIQQYDDLCCIFGCEVMRKSKTLKFPSVPKECLVHFIRGCWDGDGSLYWAHRQKRYCYPTTQYTSGSEDFIQGLDSALRANTRIAGATIFPQRGYYVFLCSGVRAQEVARYLYSENGPGLERKKNIALEFESWEPKVIRKGTLQE